MSGGIKSDDDQKKRPKPVKFYIDIAHQQHQGAKTDDTTHNPTKTKMPKRISFSSQRSQQRYERESNNVS